ncbi:unnamed protein product [Amoebophrya sp. A25]|nr:unnamed protein product [Amoebophrya sp. A25]|eukprot:GSA25T00002275001.1
MFLFRRKLVESVIEAGDYQRAPAESPGSEANARGGSGDTSSLPGSSQGSIAKKQISKCSSTHTLAGGDLKKCLTLPDLVAYSVSNMVGAGIFVIVGSATISAGGLPVVFSFILAALLCSLSGITYAEFASSIPTSGSAYVYAFTAIGELPAFIIAHLFSLSCSIGSGIAARSCAGYIRALVILLFGSDFWIFQSWSFLGGILSVNLVGPTIVFVETMLLLRGAKESASLNNFLVGMNVSLMALFTILGFYFSDSKNFEVKELDVAGVLSATGRVYYSFLGFDSVCMLSQETPNAKRTIPAALFLGLGVVCVLYSFVGAALAGMQSVDAIDVEAPLSSAFLAHHFKWGFHLTTFAAITTTLAATFVGIMVQPRLWIHVANDGLLPSFLASVDPETQTPFYGTLMSGSFAGIAAGLFQVDLLADICSGGMLVAYCLLSLAIVIVRYVGVPTAHPERSAEGLGSSTSKTAISALIVCVISFSCIDHFCVQATAAIGLAIALVVLKCTQTELPLATQIAKAQEAQQFDSPASTLRVPLLLGHNDIVGGSTSSTSPRLSPASRRQGDQGKSIDTTRADLVQQSRSASVFSMCFPTANVVAVLANLYVLNSLSPQAMRGLMLWILLGLFVYGLANLFGSDRQKGAGAGLIGLPKTPASLFDNHPVVERLDGGGREDMQDLKVGSDKPLQTSSTKPQQSVPVAKIDNSSTKQADPSSYLFFSDKDRAGACAASAANQRNYTIFPGADNNSITSGSTACLAATASGSSSRSSSFSSSSQLPPECSTESTRHPPKTMTSGSCSKADGADGESLMTISLV